MIDPFFDLPHWFPRLDRRRTGHATNRLPRRLCLVAQVRIGRGERLAFHFPILVDQISPPQQRGEAVSCCYRSQQEKHFSPAIKEMTLPDKPTSRNQRYRRTSAGEALARHLKESTK